MHAQFSVAKWMVFPVAPCLSLCRLWPCLEPECTLSNSQAHLFFQIGVPYLSGGKEGFYSMDSEWSSQSEALGAKDKMRPS